MEKKRKKKKGVSIRSMFMYICEVWCSYLSTKLHFRCLGRTYYIRQKKKTIPLSTDWLLIPYSTPQACGLKFWLSLEKKSVVHSFHLFQVTLGFVVNLQSSYIWNLQDKWTTMWFIHWCFQHTFRHIIVVL